MTQERMRTIAYNLLKRHNVNPRLPYLIMLLGALIGEGRP